METEPVSPSQGGNEPGMVRPWLLIVLAIVVLAGIGFFSWNYWQNKKTVSQPVVTDDSVVAAPTPDTAIVVPTSNPSVSPSPNTLSLTNDQIFQEVASQFGLTKSGLAYFRIFGQDKVQYAIAGAPAGTNYVYKTAGVWKMAQQNASSVASCDSFASIPVNYRPVCVDSNGKTLYMDANNQSINYSPSAMTSYIGQ